jgi:hypothetical protein
MKKNVYFIPLVLLSFFSTPSNSTPWSFEIAPYLWAINMNGTVGEGSKTLYLDETFSDLLKQLNMGGMVYATAHRDNIGFYTNAVYASLSDSDSDKVETVSINVKNKFGIIGLGVSYIVLNHEWANDKKFSVEPYAGIRYTFNNTTLEVDTLKLRQNVNWVDPVIGIQLDYDFNKHWGSQLVGDIGGTNATTQNSYSAGAFIKYKPDLWQHLKTYLGYRILSQHYETGSGANYYDWNVKLFGPVIGLGFTF